MRTRLVSVITPFYNPGRYLAEAIESVLLQSYAPFELLLVDDGSKDGSGDTAARVAEANDRVRLLRLADNQGQAAARNAALEEAQGEFFAFLDADDVMVVDRLNVQVEYLSGHVDVDVVLGSVDYILEPGVDPPPWFAERERRRPAPMTMMARRSVFHQVGLFDPRYRIGEDTEWLLRASAEGVVIAELDRVVTHRRIHGANLTYASEEMHSAIRRAVLDIVRHRLAEKRRSR